MGMLYTGVFQAVAVTAAQDLFEVLAPAARSVVLHKVSITQSTEAGDAQAEMLRYSIRRVTGAPTSGSGGSAVTPVSLPPGVTFGGTLEANNTTRISGGTIVVLEEEAAHVATGWLHQPPPEQRHEIEGATRLVIGLESAPADSVTLSGTILFEVIGGI